MSANQNTMKVNDDERLHGHDLQQRAFPLFAGELKGAWNFLVVRYMLTTIGGSLMNGSEEPTGSRWHKCCQLSHTTPSGFPSYKISVQIINNDSRVHQSFEMAV